MYLNPSHLNVEITKISTQKKIDETQILGALPYMYLNPNPSKCLLSNVNTLC